MAQDRGRTQQLLAAAKQALLNHSFLHARHLLTQAIQLHPGFKLYRMRALASACLEDYEAALDDAETVIEMMPTSSDGWYQKGFALFQLHDYSGAARAFHQGLTLNPADQIMRRGFWDAVNLLGQTPWLDAPELQPPDIHSVSTGGAQWQQQQLQQLRRH